mmetsp:Transcript_10001/g.25807  ORF Transcript_10001/g.25807 Transcript_10001/m.25807 type:complete len:201 (-) Transcript_10001:469-1071(-)
MHPTDQTSMEDVYSVHDSSSSGARYHSVTTSCVIGGGGMPLLSPWSCAYCRASPKSHTLSSPRLLYRMLEVFRSRCRIQFSCRYATPESSWSMSCFASDTENGCFILSSMQFLRSCSMYSITMYTSSLRLPMTTSGTLTMLGWWNCTRMLISRMAVLGKPSLKASFTILTRFSAHISSVLMSRALYTTPYAPSEILRMRS